MFRIESLGKMPRIDTVKIGIWKSVQINIHIRIRTYFSIFMKTFYRYVYKSELKAWFAPATV